MIKLRSLAIENWPERDRTLWQQANSAARSVFDETHGAALKLRPKTRQNYKKIYGIWLQFLKENDWLVAGEEPGDRVTRDRVRAWVQSMVAVGRANGTIGLYQISLHAMLKIIAPDRRFEFLYRPGGRSIWVAYRSIPKPFPEHDIDDLLKSLKAFRASADSEALMPQRHIMIRDAALMALILMFGPRVGDIASMRLGFHLFEGADGELMVSFPGETTKGKRLLEYAPSTECADYIRDYLTNIRPEFSQTGETDAVWISEDGQMLTIANITTIFRRRIKEWLGEEHGPHTARKWLRSSASRRSPEAACDTALVLGHSPMVSLRHYAEATDRQAGRRHAENLGRLRKQTEGMAERLFGEI
ncbi:MAG: hypothetical protein ING30_08635 [Burkholderiales bacterium]|nr:hypothetical protein [Burkholderiales bacterium]